MLTCGEAGEQLTACGSAMYRKREKHDGENDACKAHSIRVTGRACDSARRSAPYGVRPAAQAGNWSSKRPRRSSSHARRGKLKSQVESQLKSQDYFPPKPLSAIAVDRRKEGVSEGTQSVYCA